MGRGHGSRIPAGAAGIVMLGTLAAGGVAPADEAILIGGSHGLQDSQERTELNVRWIGDVLERRGVPTTTFFTDGAEAGPDVQFTVPTDAPRGTLEPLARVFGDLALERRRYREHALPDVASGTRREVLEPALADVLERTSDEALLLVHDGHGNRSPMAPADVTLDLWGDTAMSARELHALVATHRGAASEPFRFVFTQCYSGGFHRLAYADPDGGLELAATPRCGFTADSAYRRAEGCGIDTGDHRDYTTFFFAALGDRERDDTVLDRDPDIDADGAVTLREAHLHTLEKAWSTDLSRSSSEDWLERWQPWYLRWLPQPPSPPNNEYAELFRRLAAHADIPLDGRIGRTLRTRLAGDESRLDTLRAERTALHGTIDETRHELQRRTIARWPALRDPYTSGYRELALDGELERVSEWLADETDYATLLERQDREAELGRELLGAERDATQTRKLLRLRHLATLKGQLATYGSDAERASYAALLDCEERPLVAAAAVPEPAPETATATLEE